MDLGPVSGPGQAEHIVSGLRGLVNNQEAQLRMPTQPNYIQSKILLLGKGTIILCTSKEEEKRKPANDMVLSHILYKSDFRGVIM